MLESAIPVYHPESGYYTKLREDAESLFKTEED